MIGSAEFIILLKVGSEMVFISSEEKIGLMAHPSEESMPQKILLT